MDAQGIGKDYLVTCSARDALGYTGPRAFPPLAYSALVPSRRAAAATACLPQPLVRYRSHPRGRMGWWTSEQHRKPLAGRSLTALLQALRARLHAFSVTLPFQTPSDSCVSHVAAVHTPSDSAWG
jgi:hypothetical protein